MNIFRGWVLVLFCTSSAVFADAPINAWNRPASGNWDDPSAWSLGALPGSSQSVLITNSGWKAVAINPSTPVNFPDSMTVSNLTIRGAWDTENVLLLNYFGTAVPLTVLNGLTLQDDGRIVNFNSGLVVQGGTFLITNSTIIQDGGFVSVTNVPMHLQNAEYDLTNGVFEAGEVDLGYVVSASFNQYDGTVVIANLAFGEFGASAGGHYALYGGYLFLPNGLTVIGGNNAYSTYFQANGTNRTASVYMEPNQFGVSPAFTLNGGLLADNSTWVNADDYGSVTLNQNGGTHIVTNTLYISGSSTHGIYPNPGTYSLNGGTLSAGAIELNANQGDSVFVQSNGTATAGTVYGHSQGYFGSFNTYITLAGGSLSCSNFTLDDGNGSFNQSGGALVVSNLLTVSGYRDLNIRYYGRYTFTGGTVMASNINIAADCVIGDGSANRISNPGFFSLSHLLQISNAVEQLGGFILASNATIDLAGSASRLSFANSSGQVWDPGATLIINNWNGNPSGGGAEQLKFGTSASGLTASQLAQIQFSNPSGYPSGNYSAQLLSTGELVPGGGSGPPSGLVNSWTNPASGNWEDLKWSLGILPASNQTIMITNQGWKAVAIGANTTQNFPQSLNVSNIFLGGYTDSFNVLLLNYAGFAVPLIAGSINVGSNSAMTILASAVNVTNTGNSRLEVGGTVNQGDFPAVNTSILSLGNIGPGSYNLTNGTLTVVTGYVTGGTFPAQFNQYGGYHSVSSLSITGPNQSAGQVGRGEYDLYGGSLGGSLELHQGGLLKQSGGTFVGSVWFDGTYELEGGLFTSPNLDVPTTDNGYTLGYPGGEVVQTGGTNQTGPIYLGGVGTGDLLHTSPVPGAYVLSNGLVVATSAFLDVGGTVTQTGGTFTNSGQLSVAANFLHPSSGLAFYCGQYGLQGGFLAENSFVNSGYFTQSGGTNQVAGPTQLTSIDTEGMGEQQAHYTLSGGLFTTTGVTVSNAFISQSGGSLITGNLGLFDNIAPSPRRSLSGYILSGGQLAVSGIQVGGYAVFRHQGGTLLEPGLLTLAGGLWDEQTSGQQFGPLQVSSAYNLTNSIISLPVNSCILHFADSSGVAWTGGVTLVISNWTSSGNVHVFFGSNASALTTSQLAQIQFSNPGGYPPGNYGAQLLSTGELVPNAPRPTLQATRTGSALVFTWTGNYRLLSATNLTGPYTPVSGASSPWTNHFTKPREFFMLQGF